MQEITEEPENVILEEDDVPRVKESVQAEVENDGNPNIPFQTHLPTSFQTLTVFL